MLEIVSIVGKDNKGAETPTYSYFNVFSMCNDTCNFYIVAVWALRP